MRRIFVIGDIHGAFLALKQCLERCKFNYERDILICLGDIVDGWSDTYKCVEELLKIKNLIVIMGNHDEWFIDYFRTGVHPAKWLYGGNATIISYLRELGKDHMLVSTGDGYTSALNPGDIPESHKNFFRKMIYRYEYKDLKNKYCFVHGGFDRDYPIKDQHWSVLLWDRELWKSAKATRAKILENVDQFTRIFIGHTHVHNFHYNADAKPLTIAGVTNLDTSAGGLGKLTIMNMRTGKYWQSDFVHKLYPDELGRR
jgi:serine/threonine protein phosphatase 1